MSKTFHDKMMDVEDNKLDPIERILLKKQDDRTPEDISMLEAKVEVNIINEPN